MIFFLFIASKKRFQIDRIQRSSQYYAGYGRNYLLPNGKAVLATPENLEKVEKKRMELEKGEMQALEVAKGRAKAVEKAELTVFAKIGEENRLYGSVGTQDISEALTKAGVKVEKKETSVKKDRNRNSGRQQQMQFFLSGYNAYLPGQA